MQFKIMECRFSIGAEAVTIVTRNPLGGLTNIETTQAALDAARANPAQPWGDDELQTVCAAQLPTMFPGVAGITATLYEAPAPPE